MLSEGTVWNFQGALYYEGTLVQKQTVEGTLVENEAANPDGITDTFSTTYPFSAVEVRINGLVQEPTEVTPILNTLTGQYESYKLSAVPQDDYEVFHSYVRTANKTNADILYT